MIQGSPSWSSDEYFRTESTDVDTTPHCDWIPGGWNNAWHTSNACDAIPGIACDGSGNVVSLKITEKVSLFHFILVLAISMMTSCFVYHRASPGTYRPDLREGCRSCGRSNWTATSSKVTCSSC